MTLLAGKTVAITGATGFIGGHLVKACLQAGATVRVLIRNHHSALPPWGTSVQRVSGNLADTGALATLIQDADVVFHCAATLQFWGDFEKSYQTNVTGTKNVVEACLQYQAKRLVHVSTVGVHGPEKAHYQSDETAPFTTYFNTYLTSKIQAEERVWEAIKQNQLPATIIRPGHVYGPKDHSFIIQTILNGLKYRYLVFIGDGRVNITLTYIDNLIHALLLAATRPEALGEAFIITDGSDVTFYDFVASIAQHSALPVPRWQLPVPIARAVVMRVQPVLNVLYGKQQAPPLDLLVNIFASPLNFDISKAKKQLGYQPQIDFDEGMRRTMA